jgi:hypothetical protein
MSDMGHQRQWTALMGMLAFPLRADLNGRSTYDR